MARNDAKDALAYVPWYWRDWRASTARAVLIHDPAAVMAYRELLDAMWGQAGCSLPDDDKALCALSGLTPKVWARVRSKVLQFIPLGEAGRRTHPRALHEWEKASGLREAKRLGGIKGNASRWGSDSDDTPIGKRSDSDLYAIAQRSPPSPSPSPSPSPTPKAEEPDPPAAGAALPHTLPALAELWNRVASETGMPKVMPPRTLKTRKVFDRSVHVAVTEEPNLATWERCFRAVCGDDFLRSGGHATFEYATRVAGAGKKWLDKARQGWTATATASTGDGLARLNAITDLFERGRAGMA